MSDGRIIIDTTLDTTDVEKGTEKVKKALNTTKKEVLDSNKETVKLEKEMKKLSDVLGGEVPESTKEAYENIYKLKSEIRNTSREFGTHSTEAKNARSALNEYVLGLDDATFKQVYMRSQLGLTDAQLNQQANSIKLNARMIKLMGSQTEILTKRMQGLQEHGVKPSDLLPASTLGQFQMLNETMRASENPIYKLSSGYRALGTSMEKTIKGWTAQKMAVKLAGDDMVKYGLLLRGITAGQASLAMAFPIVGIAAVLAYGMIFSSAIKANEGLQQLAESAKGKLSQAFKPLLDVAGKFLAVVFNIVIKVSDMMIKFNEMHPIISKVIATIALLAPVFTLLLLPLNMGIGLLAGWKVAISAAWTAVGGIASAVGLAASTFLAFATVIGAVVGGLIYFYKTNETFRNTVLSEWDSISSKARVVFGGLVTLFAETLPNAFREGGFTGLLTAVGGLFNNLINTISSKAPELLNSGGQIITNIIQGIAMALPSIIEKMNETRLVILNAIASNLPQILQTGAQIITMLIQGISQSLPILLSMGVQILSSIINIIVTNLPTILQAGIQILIAVINGISSTIPQLVEMLPKIISTIVAIISQNLPQIINAGIQILVAIISGLIQAIPQLVGAIPQIVSAIINAFSNVDWGTIGSNIMSGIGSGIRSAVGSVIDAAVSAASSIKDSIAGFFDIHSPSRVMRDLVGKNIMRGIGVGVELETPKLNKDIVSNVSDLTAKLKTTVDYETSRNTAGVVSKSNRITSSDNSNDTSYMDKFATALDNLSKRPIQTSVNVGGREIAEATSEHSDKISGQRLSLAQRGVIV